MAILTYSMTPQRRQILGYLSVIRVVRQSETIIFTEPWIYRWLSARLQHLNWDKYVGGLVQDCSISIALALEILHWTIDICMIVLKGTSNIDRYQTNQSTTTRKPITMTSWWVRWRLKSPAATLFTQPFIQAQIKKKFKSSASLAFVRGIHRWPVNSPHKGPVTRKMFLFDDVIMDSETLCIILLMQCNARPLKLYVVVKKMFSLNHEFIFTT